MNIFNPPTSSLPSFPQTTTTTYFPQTKRRLTTTLVNSPWLSTLNTLNSLQVLFLHDVCHLVHRDAYCFTDIFSSIEKVFHESVFRLERYSRPASSSTRRARNVDWSIGSGKSMWSASRFLHRRYHSSSRQFNTHIFVGV